MMGWAEVEGWSLSSEDGRSQILGGKRRYLAADADGRVRSPISISPRGGEEWGVGVRDRPSEWVRS